MRRTTTTHAAAALLLGVAILGFFPGVLAHGGDEGMDMGHDHEGGGGEMPPPNPNPEANTYFLYPEHQLVLWAHIGLMTLGWVVMLPVAVMLSLARSRYTIPLQLVFLATNAAGLFTGFVYNHETPDLYPGNAHHKLGWLVTWLVAAQFAVGVLARLAGFLKSNYTTKSFIPVSTEAMAEHQRHQPLNRFSNDSGQGTERNTASLRSHSSSDDEEAAIPLRAARKELHDEESDEEFDHFLGGGGGGDAHGMSDARTRHARSGRVVELAKKAAGLIKSPRAWKVLTFGYNFVDRTILILAFITIATGVITQGRFFEGGEVFSGLAHWIKGGVFFWLGLFTLGRWCGAFAEVGWAWNLRPKQKTGKGWRPSAEFLESFLIFFYGGTNIFLEHIGGWGGAWSSQDLEHMSITVLFIGGGLAGMLVESTSIRDLLNTSIAADSSTHDEEQEAPEQYKFSLNPIPALVILLLGIMMSSHTQTNMLSSMVHKQWGQLLTGASMARALTYILVWLRPPKSILPSRPPTELLAAFGLMAGGVIFMASSGDTIQGMFNQQLDAMFFYTVTMGFMALLMAWVVGLMALKGWAVRREMNRARRG